MLVFVLAWVSACVGCGVAPARSAPRELAASLTAETVALVTEPTDTFGNEGPYCAGVWVSPTQILTAGHCVADLGEPPAQAILSALDPESFPEWNPVGAKVQYATVDDEAGSYWTGRVQAYDKAHDLGLVVVDAPMPAHPFARFSPAAIEPGDRVEFVGHPMGHAWSYAEGYVSAVRDDNEASDAPEQILQVAGPLSHGNSGSGAFDARGQLLGLASYIQTDLAGMGFFVGRASMLAFLHVNGWRG